MIAELLALALAAGCSATGYASLATCEATIVADWHSTRAMAERDWKGYREANPVMGSSPDAPSVDLYMLSMASTLAVLYPVIPRVARPFVYFGVAAIELATVRGNMQAGTPW